MRNALIKAFIDVLGPHKIRFNSPFTCI